MDPHILSIENINLTSTIIYASIIIVLIIFSGFFSKCETVFSSASRAKLITYIEENKKGSRKALWIIDNYNIVLSVILIGNNIVNIAISTLGLRLFLGLFLTDANWVDVVNTLCITLVVLTFGEILPKTKGRRNPEKLSLRLSGILYFIVKILTPIAFPFYKMNEIGSDKTDSEVSNVTPDDLENIIDSMENSGEIEEDEADMLQKVLDLDEIDVKNIMTPRVDVVALDIDSSIEDIKRCFFENQFSRVPVYEGTIDHIIGVLYEKEFFKAIIQNPSISDIRPLLGAPLFVVGSMSVNKLLSLLKHKNTHLAVVLDEYAGFDGIVTMEDALEELVGEIFDEHDEVPFTIIKKANEKYLVSGDLEIENLFEEISIEEPRDNIEANTVGGWVQDTLERIPAINDTVEFKVIKKYLYDELSQDEGVLYVTLKFSVIEIHNNRIKTLELSIEEFKEEEE